MNGRRLLSANYVTCTGLSVLHKISFFLEFYITQCCISVSSSSFYRCLNQGTEQRSNLPSLSWFPWNVSVELGYGYNCRQSTFWAIITMVKLLPLSFSILPIWTLMDALSEMSIFPPFGWTNTWKWSPNIIIHVQRVLEFSFGAGYVTKKKQLHKAL